MLTLVLLILALVCFIAAAANVSLPPINFIALGLSFWVLTVLIGSGIR